MSLSRAHVLPERDDVHVRVAEQSERANHLRASLAQPEHETRLRDSRPGRLGHLQHLHGLVPVGATIANVRLKLGNRLHVVREDVQSAPRHAFHETRFASKIGRERLDENVGRRRLEVSDGGLDVIRALVLEIVAVDAGQHDVVEAPLGDGLGDVRGFVRVQRRGRARRLHRAESASSGARVAHDHDGGGGGLTLAATPTLAEVGASRLLAHRAEVELAEFDLIWT